MKIIYKKEKLFDISYIPLSFLSLNTSFWLPIVSILNSSLSRNPMNFGGRSPKWPRNSFHWFAANRTWKLWRISPSVAKLQVHFCFYDELLDWLPSYGWLYLFVCLFVSLRFLLALLLYFYFMRMKKNFCCLHCAACFVCSALCSISLSSVCSAGKTLERITQGNASRKNKTKQNKTFRCHA